MTYETLCNIAIKLASANNSSSSTPVAEYGDDHHKVNRRAIALKFSHDNHTLTLSYF
jgi:hypothetical protein